MIVNINSVTELTCDWCLAVEPTVWLLHSTLTLATPHLGLVNSSTCCGLMFPSVIYSLYCQLKVTSRQLQCWFMFELKYLTEPIKSVIFC